MNEYVYCAIDSDNNIQWVMGSSSKTRYFKTPTYLKKSIKFHNANYPNNKWRMASFLLDIHCAVITDI